METVKRIIEELNKSISVIPDEDTKDKYGVSFNDGINMAIEALIRKRYDSRSKR